MQLYKISFTETNKCYIGITTKTAEHRLARHCSGKNNYAIQNAIKKYGKENTVLTVLAYCDNWELLCLAEKEAIEKYNSKYPNGYNLTDGGEGNNGYKYTEEQKEMLSIRVKNYYKNEENLIANKERQKIVQNKKEVRDKQHISIMEYYSIEENRKKVSEKSKIQWSNEENIKKKSKQTKEYYINNPEAIERLRQQTTNYYSKNENRKLQSERLKKYHRENPDAMKKIWEKRRAKKNMVTA
jgi:hypothetical protein